MAALLMPLVFSASLTKHHTVGITGEQKEAIGVIATHEKAPAPAGWGPVLVAVTGC